MSFICSWPAAPSQLELFDDKPKLRELHGQPPPTSLLEGKRFAFLKGNETLMGTQAEVRARTASAA